MWWLAVTAWADPPRNPFRESDESDLLRLEQDLVTVVSRYAQTARKAPSIVTVVTAQDIAEHGWRTVSDVLRTLPGIYVWPSEEGRDLAAFRGVISSDDNKILLLVDGQPWYDGGYTHAWIDGYLPIANVKQIEVIKGPGSAIYGTNAFSGVINVVTWGAPDLEGARASWSAGSTGFSDATATAGGTTRAGKWDAGFSAYARFLSQIGDGLDVTPAGEADVLGRAPRRGTNFGARAQIGDLRVFLDRVDHDLLYLPKAVDDPFEAIGKQLTTFPLAFGDTFARADYLLRLGSDTTLRPVLWGQRHDDPSAYFYGGDIVSSEPGVFEQQFTTVETEKDTRRWGGSLDLEARPGIDHVVLASIGIENTEVLRFADVAFDNLEDGGEVTDFRVEDACGQPVGYGREACGKPALRNLFASAQYTWTTSAAFELTAGLRADKRIPVNSGEDAADGAFALAISPRVGALILPSDTTDVKVLYGRAFRAPSVRELLVRAVLQPDGTYEFASGNLDLLPEKIDTVEGEVESEVSDGWTVRGDASWSRVDDEIDKVNPPNQYENLEGVLQIAGAEAGVAGSVGPVRAALSYALTIAGYTGGGLYDGRTQYEFPPHMVKGDVRFGTDTLSATIFGEWYATRPRSDWSPTAGLSDGDPFALVHLAGHAGNLGPNGAVDVGFVIRNLTDAAWGTAGVYRDDADAGEPGEPAYPVPWEGEGRAVLGTLTVAL
jgi:iron complex outermembrane receptor protein